MTTATTAPATPLRVLVIDDEAPARQRLADLVRQDPGAQLVGDAGSAAAGLAAIAELEPDVVYLDVQMPGGSGLDLLRALPDHLTPLVVFSTGHDEYAIAAFDAHAIDFLLKPFSDERFQESLRRAERHRASGSLAAISARLRAWLEANPRPEAELPTPGSQGSPPTGERIAARSQGRTHFISIDQIDWVSAERDCVKLHLRETEHVVRGSLTDVVERLGAQGFVRVHRSAAVNVSRVREVRSSPTGDDLLILEGGVTLRVSRTYRREARTRLGLAG